MSGVIHVSFTREDDDDVVRRRLNSLTERQRFVMARDPVGTPYIWCRDRRVSRSLVRRKLCTPAPSGPARDRLNGPLACLALTPQGLKVANLARGQR